MNARLKFGLPALLLLLAALACTLPVEQVPPPDEIQTAAALTLQAMLTPSVTPPSSPPVSTATASPDATPTPSADDSSTATITPTYSAPTLRVLEATNCRAGPGEEYEIVFTYLDGKELEIVGRYDPGNFWLVKTDDSTTDTCWLWGQYVEVSGSYWTVASVTPPPTSTRPPPLAAIILEWNFFCEAGRLNFTVTWRDNATDETGYRVFRNGEEIVELPPNTTTYTDLFDVTGDQSVEYYIQVFSPSGTANTSIMRMRCGG
jgi:hypothetical protein